MDTEAVRKIQEEEERIQRSLREKSVNSLFDVGNWVWTEKEEKRGG